MSFTMTETGMVLTETREGVTHPADYSFATVNDYVHGVDRFFEELQWLALGMAAEIDKLQKDAKRYRWLRNYRPGLILDMLSGEEIPNDQWASDLDAEIDCAIAPPSNAGG